MIQQLTAAKDAISLRFGDTQEKEADTVVETRRRHATRVTNGTRTTTGANIVLPVAAFAALSIGISNLTQFLNHMLLTQTGIPPPAWLTAIAQAWTNLCSTLWVAGSDLETVSQSGVGIGFGGLQWAIWLTVWATVAVAASYCPPRVARWGVGAGNLLYFLGVTAEYSFAASPVWVLSASQVAGWGWAVSVAVTVSVAQTSAAQLLARWRGRCESTRATDCDR